MSVTVNRDGVLRPAEQDARLMTAMLPSPCPQNHAANLLPLPDGSLLCGLAERRKAWRISPSTARA